MELKKNMKKKDMDFFQAHQKYNLKPFGDVDKDGVKNILDCKPFDPKRDGLFGRFVNVVSGGRYGQSKEEYEEEKEIRRAEPRRFSREEKMNMETGKFETVKSGLISGSSTPISDKLISQAKNEKKMKRLEYKKQYREAYEEAKHQATLKRMKKEGTRVGSMSTSDRLNNLMGSNTKYRARNNYNPFGSMFDSGLGKPRSIPRKKSSGGGKKYAIVGGKAYPIANTKSKGKKKKSKKKYSSGVSMPGFDMMDNWGFMK